MPKVLQVIVFAAVGCAVAAVAGYFLVSAMSSNRHDRAVEAAMTAAFVFGPVGALVGGVVGFFRSGSP